MRTAIKWKIAFTIVFIIALSSFESIAPVAITNEVAIGQLKDSVGSYSNLVLWKSIMEYVWLLYILVPLLIFSKEITNIIKNKGE